MPLSVGQVVTSSSDRLAIVYGHVGRDVVLLPIVRGEARKRSHVAIDGAIHWTMTECATPGYIAAALPRVSPECLLTVVGFADDALMALCLKAQLREIESRDAPPSAKAQEIAAHFSDVQKDYFGA